MKKPTTLEKLRGEQTPEPAPEQNPQVPDAGKDQPGIPVIHKDDLEDVRQTPSKPGLERSEEKPPSEDEKDFSPEALQDILWPGRKPKKDEKAAKPEGDSESDEKAAPTKSDESPKPDDEPKKKAKKPRVEEVDDAEEREQIDTASIVKEAVSSAVDATSRALRTEAAKDDEMPVELDEEEQYLATVYDRIEKDEGIKGVGKKFRSGVIAMKEYRKRWESEHPGEEWDAEADEHSNYYEKVMPDVPSRLIRAAEARLAADETIEKKTSAIREENAELKRKVFDTEVAPVIAQTTDTMLTEIAASIGAEVAEAIKSPDGVKSLEEADPVAVEVIRGFAGHAAALNEALTKVSRSGGLYRFDQNNPVHGEIRSIVQSAQEQIKSQPRAKRVWKGREFATHSEWNRMTPAEREKHWILEEHQIRAIISDQYASAAKSAYDREMAKIERYGGARKSTQKQAQQERQEEQPERRDERTPQSPTRDEIRSVKSGPSKPGSELSEKIRRTLWGR